MIVFGTCNLWIRLRVNFAQMLENKLYNSCLSAYTYTCFMVM